MSSITDSDYRLALQRLKPLLFGLSLWSHALAWGEVKLTKEFWR